MSRTILIRDKHSALRAKFPPFRINLLRTHFSATPLFLYRYAFPGGGGYGISIPFVFYSLRNTPSASLYQRTTCPKAGGEGWIDMPLQQRNVWHAPSILFSGFATPQSPRHVPNGTWSLITSRRSTLEGDKPLDNFLCAPRIAIMDDFGWGLRGIRND